MQGLMQAWGQSGSPYDLTGDGTVNIDDLIALIMNWQQPATSGAGAAAELASTEPPDTTPTVSAAAVEAAEPRPTATAIDAAANAVSVDSVDSASDPAAPVLSTGSNAIDASETGATEQTGPGNPLDGLLGAWGQAGTPFDFDGNGVVDVDDLIHMILNWGSPPNAGPATVTAALAIDADEAEADSATAREKPAAHNVAAEKPRRDRADFEAHAARPSKPRRHDGSLSPDALARVSTSLVDRLMTAGFKDRPPANVREIVNSLNLSPRDTRSVLKNLKEAYPGGLGVNFRV
jgi:hypothetical protein